MAYPRRFAGTDALDGATHFDDEGVQLPGRFTVEITFRTFQERFLLRPSDEVNALVLGCLGRAAHRYRGLGLHAATFLSNHGNLLATPDCAATMSNFMRDFGSTLGRRINDHLGRKGTFWSRRYRSIPAVDEAAVEDRFRYVLTQGTKENLVWSADQWPGVHSIHALRGGKQLVGRWRDFTAEAVLRQQVNRKHQRAERRGVQFIREVVPEIWREYPVQFVPLPHWQQDKPGTIRQRVANIIRMDAEQTRQRHERDGTRPMGRRLILQVDPFDAPEEPKRSPAPMCHASTNAGRRAYRRGYRAFAEVVLDTNQQLAKHRAACSPLGSTVGGPLPAVTVTVERNDVAPTFVGGNPSLHYDPLVTIRMRPGGAGTGATGPPG